MRVLVTGGAGYIGDAAVDYLLTAGAKVTVLDNLTYGGAYMRRHDALTFVRGDIRDTTLIDKLLIEHDAVLHLAAIVGDGACAANPGLTIETNEQATEHIAKRCRELDRHLVFASTCSVYGASDDYLNEDSPAKPLSLYAASKLKAEKSVGAVPRHYIFRLGTLFGLSTEHARLRCDLVANILTYRAMSGQTLKVFGGEQWRPLLHVRDAGELMASATLKQKPSGCSYGTYILAYRNYTISDLAKNILSICNLPMSRMEITEMPFEDQRNYRVDSNRRGAFWLTRFTLFDGISEMAQVVKEGRIANLWSTAHHNARYAKETF